MTPETLSLPVWVVFTVVSWLAIGWFVSSIVSWGKAGRPARDVAMVAVPLAIWCWRSSIPLVWPVLSGWGWMFALSLVAFLFHSVNLARRSNQGLILSGLASILFALPAWMTRDQSGLLTGTIPIGDFGGLKLMVLLSGLALAARYFAARPATAKIGKNVVVYALLIGGTLVFSIPFFWLLLTSFKEERDMTNANGLVWIPKVTRTAKALDPLAPLYEAEYQGTTVQVEKRSTEAGGLRVSIVSPSSLAGGSFVVPPAQLKEVPREMKVVSAMLKGQKVEALLLNEDGEGAHIQVLTPAERKGEMATLSTAEVEPIRTPGLLWQNYPNALAALPAEAENGLRYLLNTLFLCTMTVVGTILSCTLVAYGFARLRFPGRGFLFGLLLATMMLPGAVTMLPSFLIFRELGWVDSLTPLWAPAFLGGAFNIFLLRQFFLTLPKELEDAAKIDGCGHLKTLISVMAPQIKPALVVVGIWTFIGAWNNFMGPLIYVSSSEKMTIAYAMQLFAGDKSNQPGLLMAFATMALMPVVLLFFLAQRAFVEGIALTGRTG